MRSMLVLFTVRNLLSRFLVGETNSGSYLVLRVCSSVSFSSLLIFIRSRTAFCWSYLALAIIVSTSTSRMFKYFR